MMGCYANEWSQSMSDEEVRSFAENVQSLYGRVYCNDCHTWITSKTCSGKMIAECKCRNKQYSKA